MLPTYLPASKFVECANPKCSTVVARSATSCASCGTPTSQMIVGVMRPARVAKARPGDAAEDALYDALENGAFVDLHSTSDVPLDAEMRRVSWIRQYPWGAYLSPRRRFSSDAGFPNARVLVEIDGGAHAAGKAKQRTDTERRGLAGANGWRVVAVTPEMVHNGEAIDLIRKALASPCGAAGV